jgi:Kdo2-lipid IVA lauroyltransferase/acyltransferase
MNTDKIKAEHQKSALLFDTCFRLAFLKPQYWATWLLLGCSFVIFLLPAKLTDWLAKYLGDFSKKSNKKRYKIASTNIKMCFPDLSHDQHNKMVSEHFRAQARSVLHYGLILWGGRRSAEKHMILHGQEHIDGSHAEGKAVIVMTVHSVGLEAAVSALGRSNKISGPFKSMRNELVNHMVARARSRFGALVYTREAGLRPIIKDVRGGYVMCYLPDEDLGADKSIFAPLFGVQKATIPVLGRLARSCDANVHPCISCYDEAEAKYHIHVLPKLENFPQLDDQLDTLAMNQSIEELVKRCPAQYFWTLRLFKTRPEGEERFY